MHLIFNYKNAAKKNEPTKEDLNSPSGYAIHYEGCRFNVFLKKSLHPDAPWICAKATPFPLEAIYFFCFLRGPPRSSALKENRFCESGFFHSPVPLWLRLVRVRHPAPLGGDFLGNPIPTSPEDYTNSGGNGGCSFRMSFNQVHKTFATRDPRFKTS